MKKEYIAMVCFWSDADDHYAGYSVVGVVYKTRGAAVKAAKRSEIGTHPSVTEVPRGTFDGLLGGLNGRVVLSYPKGYDSVPKRHVPLKA